MARLTTQERANLPASDFAGPGRSYPIPDKKHAKAALMLINKKPMSDEQRAKVRRVADAMLAK